MYDATWVNTQLRELGRANAKLDAVQEVMADIEESMGTLGTPVGNTNFFRLAQLKNAMKAGD